MNPLRRWRGQRTLDEAAAELGITAATLSRIERGQQWVREDIFVRLMRVTGLTADQIVASLTGTVEDAAPTDTHERAS